MGITHFICGLVILFVGSFFIISGFTGIYRRFLYLDFNFRGSENIVIKTLFGIVDVLFGIILMEEIFIIKVIFMVFALVSSLIIAVFYLKTENIKDRSKRTFGGGPDDGE